MTDSDPSTQLLMACLGDASRFRLVQALMEGARCVTDLAMEVGLSQSCTTRHLQALERRRVVLGTRDGKRVMYRLRREEPVLEPLLAWALRSHVARRGAPEEGTAPRLAGAGGGSPPTSAPGHSPPPGHSPSRGGGRSRNSAPDRGGGQASAGLRTQSSDPEPGAGRPAGRPVGRVELEDYLL